MKKYGVLVVDDSPLMRKLISIVIEESEAFFVIGKARNGLDAIEKVERLKPDIVTMDIEMPEVDGLTAAKILMDKTPVPIVMLSNDTSLIIKSFEVGAVDFILKDQLINIDHMEMVTKFYERLTLAVQTPLPKMNKIVEEKPIAKKIVKRKKSSKQLLIIGSSTGGPAALKSILPKYPTNFSLPILVIQHMPPGFTKSLAERFDGLCQLHVKEVEHGELLEAGTIYIAPAGMQTLLTKNENGQYMAKLEIGSLVETLYKPSIDVTLLSLEDSIKDEVLTVILTGMGNDGLKGCSAMKEHGGKVIAESEETCVVYGMPKVVIEAGLVDVEKPLPLIYDAIMEIVYK